MKTAVLLLILALATSCAHIPDAPNECPLGASSETEAGIRDDLNTAFSIDDPEKRKGWVEYVIRCFGSKLVKAALLGLLAELEQSIFGGASDKMTTVKAANMRAFACGQLWLSPDKCR